MCANMHVTRLRHETQHTATHCNTLQHTATQYSTLQQGHVDEWVMTHTRMSHAYESWWRVAYTSVSSSWNIWYEFVTYIWREFVTHMTRRVAYASDSRMNAWFHHDEFVSIRPSICGCVRCGSLICEAWLIHMCDMTHSYVWHECQYVPGK